MACGFYSTGPQLCNVICTWKIEKAIWSLRLWWDEIVNTVVTRAEPHNQCVLHPNQDRVLSVRENARLQGFPDSYKLCGSIKKKYIQVGNAVAVPVGVALGYAFGMASQGLTDDNPVIKLPFKYPKCRGGSF